MIVVREQVLMLECGPILKLAAMVVFHPTLSRRLQLTDVPMEGHWFYQVYMPHNIL
jgi:hypothetical protein